MEVGLDGVEGVAHHDDSTGDGEALVAEPLGEVSLDAPHLAQTDQQSAKRAGMQTILRVSHCPLDDRGTFASQSDYSPICPWPLRPSGPPAAATTTGCGTDACRDRKPGATTAQ